MTLNLTELEGIPALILQWKEPSWDIRNLTLVVEIYCSDTRQENQILEIRNLSDYELILTKLNLNVTITCCLMPITTEGNGSVVCEEASFAKTGNYDQQRYEWGEGSMVLYSLAAINIDTNGRVCGALVRFGCYQHRV